MQSFRLVRLGPDSNGIGICDAFLCEDSPSKRFTCVSRQDLNPSLHNRLAMVVSIVDEMDCAARFARTTGDDRIMDALSIHSLTAEIRQQRWMNIEHAPCPRTNAQSPQIASKQHQFDSMFKQEFIESITRSWRRFARQDDDSPTNSAAARNRQNILAVRHDESDVDWNLAALLRFN